MIPTMELESGRILQRLKPLFQENFEKLGELGAAVFVWQNGKPLIDLYGGFFDADRKKTVAAHTGVLVLAATKRNWRGVGVHGVKENKIQPHRAGGPLLRG